MSTINWKIHLPGANKAVIEVPNRKYYYLPNQADDLQKSIVNEPSADLKYDQVKPIMEFFALSQHEIAELLEVDPSTLFRWGKNEKTIGKLRSKAMYELDEIIAKGVTLFGSEENFKKWLSSDNYSLGDRKPIELIKDPFGLELVDGAIEAMGWGNLV